MKSTDPRLPAAIMAKVMSHPDFHTVATMVQRNTSGKVYLVGGKVYRTAIELIHGYNAGAQDCDWDFLCVGEVVSKHRAYLEPGWYADIPEYDDYKAYSLGLLQQHPKGYNPFRDKPIKLGKVDIIGIKDVSYCVPNDIRTDSHEDYFHVVPLTIQAIALTTDNRYPKLLGRKAIESIERKVLYKNHEHGTLGPIDWRSYFRKKCKSLGFTDEYNTLKIPCDCERFTLFNRGCQQKDRHY